MSCTSQSHTYKLTLYSHTTNTQPQHIISKFNKMLAQLQRNSNHVTSLTHPQRFQGHPKMSFKSGGGDGSCTHVHIFFFKKLSPTHTSWTIRFCKGIQKIIQAVDINLNNHYIIKIVILLGSYYFYTDLQCLPADVQRCRLKMHLIDAFRLINKMHY